MLTKQQLTRICGFKMQGDVGPYTSYTMRGNKIVLFGRTQLKDEHAKKQEHMRNMWRAAAADWQRLTKHERANWSQAPKRLSMPITGYNLWIHYWIVREEKGIQTIARQSNIALLPLSIELPPQSPRF